MAPDTGPRHFRRLLARLLDEDRGQDLVEYALLTGVVSAAAAILLPLAGSLGDLYQSWVDNVWDIWEPPAPGS
jgi:Flp pilus assembly pilin Flp